MKELLYRIFHFLEISMNADDEIDLEREFLLTHQEILKSIGDDIQDKYDIEDLMENVLISSNIYHLSKISSKVRLFESRLRVSSIENKLIFSERLYDSYPNEDLLEACYLYLQDHTTFISEKPLTEEPVWYEYLIGNTNNVDMSIFNK